jgi:hypothetical protein
MTPDDGREVVREIAITLYVHEMDAPDLVSREQAQGCYDHPDSTGPHCGDCTNVACTCLRCVRDEADAKARAILTAIEASGRWKIVPVEPTGESVPRMIEHGMKASLGGDYNWAAYMADLYRIGISASPKATG